MHYAGKPIVRDAVLFAAPRGGVLLEGS